MTPAVNWTFRAHLVRVIDGDTIIVRVDTCFATTREERIRLLGIDTPEMVGVTKAQGLKVKLALHDMLYGRTLLLVTEMEKVDGFRRYLGTVYADGININQWLLDEGHAVRWQR